MDTTTIELNKEWLVFSRNGGDIAQQRKATNALFFFLRKASTYSFEEAMGTMEEICQHNCLVPPSNAEPWKLAWDFVQSHKDILRTVNLNRLALELSLPATPLSALEIASPSPIAHIFPL